MHSSIHSYFHSPYAHTPIHSYFHSSYTHIPRSPYQIGEVVTDFTAHDPHGVTEPCYEVHVGVKSLRTGVDDEEDEGRHKLISTGWPIARDLQSSCPQEREIKIGTMLVESA